MGKNKKRSLFHRTKSVETETIYLDDTWRLTEDKVEKTLRMFGVRLFKDEQELKHTLKGENVFTSGNRAKNVGFGNNEG
jgi:hypothetical protein